MEVKELICICCPMGCNMEVKIEGNKVLDVTGNTCPRGKMYAEKECTNPTRIVTSSVIVKNSIINRVSVKTESDIPKDKIFQCMKEIKNISIDAPVNIGDIVIKNVANTNVDVIATKKIDAIK